MHSEMGNDLFNTYTHKFERDQYEEGYMARCQKGNKNYKMIDIIARNRIPFIHGWLKAHDFFIMEEKRNAKKQT